jgi:hypothetical protein
MVAAQCGAKWGFDLAKNPLVVWTIPVRGMTKGHGTWELVNIRVSSRITLSGSSGDHYLIVARIPVFSVFSGLFFLFFFWCA